MTSAIVLKIVMHLFRRMLAKSKKEIVLSRPLLSVLSTCCKVDILGTSTKAKTERLIDSGESLYG